MKRARLTAYLPATPCTPQFRDKIVSIAEEQNRSIADVTREALEFFLTRFDKNIVNAGDNSIKETK